MNNSAINVRRLLAMTISSAFIILTSATMLLAMPVKAQQATTEKLTAGFRQESLEQALESLQSQTNFVFYYRKADVKAFEGLNLTYGTHTVAEILQTLLQNTFLTFRQEGSNIFIEKTSPAEVYTVSGRVLDQHHAALPYATVRLTKNQPFQGAQTDTGGYFKLTITQKGDYLLHISAVGKDSLTVAFVLADRPAIRLPDIVLPDASHLLKEVVIKSKKPFIEQRIDMTVVNVGALISNTGDNALEVLQKSPGVLVDANGNISFEGKPGVLVLIDGKPTYLSGENLANYLKSLPASMLDQIELMDNPPAKYDAAGNGGVINIKTKKNQAAGFNGLLAASYGQGHYGQSNESLALNYRTGPVNIFANAAWGLRQAYRELDLGRTYFNPDGSLNSTFNQVQYIKSRNENANLKLGIDYAASPKTTWGMVLTGTVAPAKSTNPSTDRLYNSQGALDSVVNAENSAKKHFNNGGINVNYSHRFDSLGKALTFDLDYLGYSSISNPQFLDQTYLPGGTLVTTQQMNANLPVAIHIYTAKTDFTQPLSKTAKLETGLKNSYVTTNDQANYFDVANGVSTVDDDFSNSFRYNENINAAYLNLDDRLGRLEVQAGLRLENTNDNGHQLGNATHPDSTFAQHYTNLFPTAYLSYKLDTAGNNLLLASYGRRVGRPYYQDLNPFVQPSDKFTYSEGNPFLRPQFSDNYKLSYSYKSIFSASLFYNHVSDLQNEVIRQQGDIFIDGTGNIGAANFIGALANITVDLAKWWSLNTYLQLTHNDFKGQLSASYLDRSSTSGMTNLTSQFNLPDGWSLEIDGFYVSKFADGQSEVDGFGQLNGGIQKKIMHNKGTLKFGGQDLLHSYTAQGVTDFIGNATATFKNRFNSQIFTLGFSYSFGTSVNSRRQRDTGSDDSEAGRIK